MFNRTICLLVYLVLSASTLSAASLPTNSVVKIHVAAAYSSYKHPWQTSQIANYTGSGAIIKNNLILTSAHVVSGAKFIEVTKENDPQKYRASLKFISHQADLALLEVEDNAFFKGTEPLKLSTQVKARDAVTVLGYPIGGNAISTTTGVVSRIEYTSYVHSHEYLLAIQIDAAINPGNSGGPAVNSEGDLIGIAMQSIKNASNIAYIVPSVMIQSFLKDTEDGHIDGIYDNETCVNLIQNQSMKDYFGLKDHQGVLVTFVDLQDRDKLRENDIILSVDGHAIANDGTIESEYGRVYFDLIMSTRQVGEKVMYKILRDKKIIQVEYTLKYAKPLLHKEFAREPRYIIFGGLVFSPLTKNYLGELSQANSNHYQMLFYKEAKTNERSEPVVMLQTIFPHTVNRGYYSGADVVDKVNGVTVRDFNHFVDLIDNAETEYITIDFIEKKKVVLNAKQAKESFADLKSIYGFTNDRRVSAGDHQ
jgi:S1-C subfamily serine protease